jgi:hypothetical protein
MLDSLRGSYQRRQAPQTRAAAVLTDFKVLEKQKVLAITTAGFSVTSKDLVG